MTDAPRRAVSSYLFEKGQNLMAIIKTQPHLKNSILEGESCHGRKVLRCAETKPPTVWFAPGLGREASDTRHPPTHLYHTTPGQANYFPKSKGTSYVRSKA